jgi:hypothetical protein
MTRYSKPVAKVVPSLSAAEPGEWIGSLADTMEIVGDIVSPVIEQAIWQTDDAGQSGKRPAKTRPGSRRR